MMRHPSCWQIFFSFHARLLLNLIVTSPLKRLKNVSHFNVRSTRKFSRSVRLATWTTNNTFRESFFYPSIVVLPGSEFDALFRP